MLILLGLIKLTQDSPENFQDLLFKIFDTDNSGEIDFNEFLIGLTMLSDSGDDIFFSFDLCDANKNGKVERQELVKLFQVTAKIYIISC